MTGSRSTSASWRRCLTDMTVTEWLRLLNRKVFFWPTEQRVEEPLAAREYQAQEHLVLVIRSSSLVAIHGPETTLSPIDTGSVLYEPRPRGRDTLLSIADYPFEEWRRRRGPRTAIAEVAVDYARCPTSCTTSSESNADSTGGRRRLSSDLDLHAGSSQGVASGATSLSSHCGCPPMRGSPDQSKRSPDSCVAGSALVGRAAFVCPTRCVTRGH